jgi:glycosyltransferase involved in cell wall biosynthesis
MATYNGQKYVVEQITSILKQLGDEDEIIVSDDSSTDNTLLLLNEQNDPRIKIYANNQFHSPIYNFEFCLTKAVGDIIYLADQDDIWLPGKVKSIMKIFGNDPDVTLVASDAQIINANGDTIANTFYSNSFVFTSNVLSNIVRNRFCGCSLAIRQSILQMILPFPRNIPMHDSWIGIMNQLFGKVHFINSPLVAFRKHDANSHPLSRTGIIRLLTWRWNLVKALLHKALPLYIHVLIHGNDSCGR